MPYASHAARHDARPDPAARPWRVLRAFFGWTPSTAAARVAVTAAVVTLIAATSSLGHLPVAETGGTGSTNGAGSAFNPRIASINIDGPDDQQWSTVAAAGSDQAGAGWAAGRATGMIDESLIRPVSDAGSAAARRTDLAIYTVRQGDTLSGIAARYGVSLMTIWWANHLSSPSQLKTGQKLRIPPIDGVLYTAHSGDTVQSIARRYHASAGDIRSYNGLSGDGIPAGLEIMVPDGRGAPAPTPTPPDARRHSASTVSGPGGTATSSGGCTGCAFSGTLRWPVPGGTISQYFWAGHPAIDIAAPVGTPILAATGGVVIFAGWRNNGGGYQVWESFGGNVYATYDHMSAVTVGTGQRVASGQQIGRVGATGDATGPHCHFDVWIGPIWAGGYRVNPLAYIR